MSTFEIIEKVRPSMAEILDGISTQSRVINALVLRETKTRYGEHKIGFLWALLEPMITVSIFVAMFAQRESEGPSGMALVPFMLMGILPFSFFRDTMTQMQGAISSNRQLFAFPQVTTFDVIIARAILETLIIASVLIFLLFLCDLAGWNIHVERPLAVLGACGLLCMMGVGCGFFFATLSPLVPSVRQVSSALLGRPLFFTSGLFFTVDSVPAIFRDYLLYNPLLHAIELLRSAFFYEFESAYGSWEYASVWAVGLLTLGLLTHQAMRRKAIVGL